MPEQQVDRERQQAEDMIWVISVIQNWPATNGATSAAASAISASMTL